MPRFQFPDPQDRSPNAPSVIVEKNQILGLYNQEHDEDALYVTESVRSWFQTAAIRNGWSTAQFAGNQCLLSAEVELKAKD